MAATNHGGPFLVVEGPTDQRFLELRVDSAVYFVQSGGRATCVKVIKSLNEVERTFLYLGIADEDYDWLQPEDVPNLVFTDTRDLESLLVRTSALDSTVLELGDHTKVRAFVQRTGMSVRDALLAKATFFGRVRTYGFIKGTTCLDGINPARFCLKDWSYDEAKCAEVCVELGLADSVDALHELIQALDAPSDWHYARGHDLVDILIGGFVHVLSGKAPPRIHVESLLRQSVQREEFEQTLLFGRVAAWETATATPIWRTH